MLKDREKSWSAERAFARYGARGEAERERASEFVALLASSGDWYARTHVPGHFTGSAWLVDRSGERVLLTHHRKLGLWLQLGGHADGDPDLAAVALREAHEESGLVDLAIEPDIFDLDRHFIPARKDEPEHYHYDVRFVVHATGSETYAVSEESHALAWRPIRALAGEPGTDASVRRMAQLWLARGATLRG